ncbi:MAG: hypothetical protein AB7V42_16040 [Thermoleophilia bacterium]
MRRRLPHPARPLGRARTVLALAAAAAIALAIGCGGSSAEAKPRFFAPTSFWNAPIPASAAIAPDSRSLVADLVRQVDDTDPWMNTDQYSTAIITAGPKVKRVRVRQTQGHPIAPIRTAFRSVPIPPGAKPAPGTDGHAVIWQPSTDTMWEFWQLRREGSGWAAAWGARITKVSRSDGVIPYPAGATASGLPLAGGLVTVADVRAGRIDHALALAIPQPRRAVFSPPANRTDGWLDSEVAIPMGTRLRLDPSVNVAALKAPRIVKMLALAAQKYGIVLRDTSGAVTFYGQEVRGSGNPFPALLGSNPAKTLRSFPWDRLQVLQAPRRCCWNVGSLR